MTIGEWLAAREPRPPGLLVVRLNEVTGPWSSAPVTEIPERFVAIARSMVTELADGGRDRTAALDLLVADALVTYAFEFTAEAMGDLDRLAVETERTFSNLALPSR